MDTFMVTPDPQLTDVHISRELLFIVVRPAGNLKNQALPSTLFGPQVGPNLVRPSGDFPRQGPILARAVDARGAGVDLTLPPFPLETPLRRHQRIKTTTLAATSSHRNLQSLLC